MIYVENRKRNLDRIKKQHPNAIILDVTSKSATRYSQLLSPFYPHGNIPIPFSEGYTATCVEAVWQGLKVFEHEDVNFATFKNNTMKNLKRTVRKLGVPKGHRKGVHGTELLNYFDARMQIYLPTYKWVLDNVPEVHNIVEKIKAKSLQQDIVLLDYNTNTDFRNISSPLSHAGLIKMYIEGTYPDSSKEYKPYTIEKNKGTMNEDNNSIQFKNNKGNDNKSQDGKVEQLTLF